MIAAPLCAPRLPAVVHRFYQPRLAGRFAPCQQITFKADGLFLLRMAVHAQAIHTDEGVRLCLFDKPGWGAMTRLAAKGLGIPGSVSTQCLFPF